MSDKKKGNVLAIVALVVSALVVGLVLGSWVRNSADRVNTTASQNTAPINNTSAVTNGGNSNGNNTSGSVVNNAGTAPCPSAPEASRVIAGNNTALVREGGETCLFEWRAPLAPNTTVTCPEGWACELDMAGAEQGKYFYGGGGHYQIDAGSFRLINSYPTGDPIYGACSALANSRAWLKTSGVDPNWHMEAGNFNCTEGTTSVNASPNNNNGGGSDQKDSCPTSSREAAHMLGGKQGNWKNLQVTGWVYNGPTLTPRYPGFGRYDYDGGQKHGVPPAGVVFTFWCKG